MAIKLGIIGSAGRMGRRIATLAHQDQDFTITCAIERPDHPAQGVDLGELLGLGKLDLPISTTFSAKPDVLINFTTPQATVDSLPAARKSGHGGRGEREQQGEERDGARSDHHLAAHADSSGRGFHTEISSSGLRTRSGTSAPSAG